MMHRQASFVFGVIAAVVAAACDRVPLQAPANSTITVNANDRVLPLGGSTEVSATVIESAGTPVQNGTVVRFTTSLGRLDPVEAQTHNGIAATTFFAGDASGVAEVRATSGGAGSTATTTPSTPTSPSTTPTTTTSTSNVVQISIGTGAVDTVMVRVNPSTVSSNGGTVQVVATVVGVGGRALPNITVSFSASRGTLSSPTAVTDANGEARVTLNTNADTDVTATAGSKTSTAAKITAQPGPSVTLTCAVGAVTNCATATVFDNITFTAGRGSTTSNIVSSTLDFGDGSSTALGSLASPANVAHRYASPGTYTAKLTATDNNGETATVQQVIRVDDLPTVTVDLSMSGLTVDATATVANLGSATVLRYEWTFGSDATPSTLTTITNTARTTYSATGTKTVTVRVVLSDGRIVSTSKQIVL